MDTIPSRPGWVKMHRSLLDSRVYSDAESWRLYCYLLMSANHATGWMDGIEISPGSLVRSQQSIADALGWSREKVKRRLARLIEYGCITSRATNKYTILSICGWETCQSVDVSSRPADDPTSDQQTTSERPNQRPRFNNEKNDQNAETTPSMPPPIDEPDGWTVVVEDMRSLGVVDPHGSREQAEARGVTAAEAAAIVAYYRSHSGGLGPGALRWRVASASPGQSPAEGWPPPSRHYADAQRAEREQTDRERERADRERRAVEAAQAQQDIEARYSTIADSLGDSEVMARLESLGSIIARAAGRLSPEERRRRYRRELIDSIAADDREAVA